MKQSSNPSTITANTTSSSSTSISADGPSEKREESKFQKARYKFVNRIDEDHRRPIYSIQFNLRILVFVITSRLWEPIEYVWLISR